MTIMTPIEGITAPRIPADPTRPALPIETFLPCDETLLRSSRRADGWSAANQRLFLEALAEGHGVEVASLRVGLSAASAYAFRRTAKGAAFALGWRAASLVARDAIAETLLVRALEGTVDTIVRGETVITRHKFDNRLALSLLARLDRQAESACQKTGGDADIKAARLVAQEFDAFLDLVGKDEGPARAGLFLARRSTDLAPDSADPTHDLAPIYALAAADRFARTGVATAGEVDIGDLDPVQRATWTADQWQRADAAGLLALAPPAPEPAETALSSQHSQHSPGPVEPDPVWWDDDALEWRTWFPPVAGDIPDFEAHEPGHCNYERSLSEAEAACMGPGPDWLDDAVLAALAAERDAWFAPDGDPAPAPSIAAPPPVAAKKSGTPRRSRGSCVAAAPSNPRSIAMTDTSHDIRTLNGLIATTLDSVDGYETAAKDAENSQYSDRFIARAAERRHVVDTLQAEVARQGGNPEDDGTLLAGAHRVFLDLKSAVTGQDDQAIVNEVERGEDHIKAKYEDALADTDLSPDTRSAIGAAWDSVKSGHDEMRDLKHSLGN